MNFTFAISSIGFAGRFIIGFIILAYLYSKDKNDQYLKKGFKILCVFGAVIFVLSVLTLLIFLSVSGFGLLTGLFDTVRYGSFSFHFPF